MLFTGLKKGERLLKEFIANPLSKFWLYFVEEQVNQICRFVVKIHIFFNVFRFFPLRAELFAQCVLKIEGDEVSAIEIVQHLGDLNEPLKLRKSDEFLSAPTKAEMEAVIIYSKLITTKCKEFFGNLLCYLNSVFFSHLVKFFDCNLNCLFCLTDDASEYLEKWANPILELKKYSWVTLRQFPTWKNVEQVMIQLNEQ